MYTNITCAFPARSFKSMQYVFVDYIYDLVETLADPYKGRIPLPSMFPITKNETFPAISYKQALILLPTDKKHSSMENA
jgi:hypothetical protein